MKFSSLLLCLKIGIYFRLSGSIFLRHSSLNVVSLTQTVAGSLILYFLGSARTIGGPQVGTLL